MTEFPVQYGTNSPFDAEDRQTIERIHARVNSAPDALARELCASIVKQMDSLERLGDVVASYPSPLASQTLGSRHRELQTLIESLSQSTPATFEFYIPTRALLGRSLVMAESNFYRFLRHVCRETIEGEEQKQLHRQATERMRMCLYTKLAEEILSSVVTDSKLPPATRERGVVALAQIWERRLSYRVNDFFPILEAAWDSRQRFTATGGTLSGTHEMFELFKAGCDPQFVDYFAQPNHCEDEIEAFREFLFGASTEELDRLAQEMAARGETSVLVSDRARISERDPATVFYEFFVARHMLAMARRFARLPGPRHTAEAYVMIHFLDQLACPV